MTITGEVLLQLGMGGGAWGDHGDISGVLEPEAEGAGRGGRRSGRPNR